MKGAWILNQVEDAGETRPTRSQLSMSGLHAAGRQGSTASGLVARRQTRCGSGSWLLCTPAPCLALLFPLPPMQRITST